MVGQPVRRGVHIVTAGCDTVQITTSWRPLRAGKARGELGDSCRGARTGLRSLDTVPSERTVTPIRHDLGQKPGACLGPA